MMEIFSMQISAESKLILLFLQQKEHATIEEIAQILNKSIRTAYRHIASLGKTILKSGIFYSISVSNLSPVVVDLKDPKKQDLKTTTTICNAININTNIRDKIATVLDKYDKTILLDEIIKHLPEPNEIAFEYILKDVIKKHKLGKVRNFVGYLITCLKAMWLQAIYETSQISKNSPIPEYAHQQPSLEQLKQISPESFQAKSWRDLINQIKAS